MKAFGWLALGCVGIVAACGSGDEKRNERGDGGATGEAEGGAGARDGAAGGSMTPDDVGGDGGGGGAQSSTPGGAGGEPPQATGGDGGTATVGGEAGNSSSEGGADGSHEVEPGTPGTVGNPCTQAGACENDLVCAPNFYCQPAETSFPESIVQAVPAPDSFDIPSSSPIVLFADDLYENVTFSVMAHSTEGVVDITDQISVVKLVSQSGKHVYVLAAKQGLPLGASVVVTIGGDIVGTLVFNVALQSPPYADGELDFEAEANPDVDCGATNAAFASLSKGWTAFGDVGAIGETGTLAPTDGTRLLAMSTGNALCGSALDQKSSIAVSGPIRGWSDSPSVVLDYDFQSSEFKDYCDSDYDDTLIGVLSGPQGAVAAVIDSVNIICARNENIAAVFPGQPDGGDEVYEETGVRSFTLAGTVGSPATLSFLVTDVGDEDLTTLVGIDRIRVE